MDEKIARLLEWAKGNKAPPFTLDINPTDKCNFKCLHCWQRAFKKIDSSYELSDEKLIEIVREALKFGVKEFEITGGGEPMMRRKLVLKLMEIIKKGGGFGNITTNGSLFDLKSIKKILKINWDRITFSLDGPDAKSNDAIRGKDNFEKVMEVIELLNQMKMKMGKNLPIIKFNVVINKKNYDKIEEMVKLAKTVNCSIIHFDSLTIHSEYGKKLKLNKKEERKFEKNAKVAKELAEKFGIFTDVDFLTKDLIEKSNEMDVVLKDESDSKNFFSLVCYEPWWHLVIKTDGSAQPCCLYDEKEENVKNKSLREIWFGSYFEKIRNNMRKKQFSKYCSICNAGQVFENRRIRSEMSWMKK
jgi:MoaA/NifB/PqqE/SkfB family radical SAM enzyme